MDEHFSPGHEQHRPLVLTKPQFELFLQQRVDFHVDIFKFKKMIRYATPSKGIPSRQEIIILQEIISPALLDEEMEQVAGAGRI